MVDNTTSSTFLQVGRSQNNEVELQLGDNSDYGFISSEITGTGQTYPSLFAESSISVGYSTPVLGFSTSFSYKIGSEDDSLNLTFNMYDNDVTTRKYCRHIKLSFSKEYMQTASGHYYGGEFRIRDYKVNVVQSGRVRADFRIKAYHSATGDTVTYNTSEFLSFTGN